MGVIFQYLGSECTHLMIRSRLMNLIILLIILGFKG